CISISSTCSYSCFGFSETVDRWLLGVSYLLPGFLKNHLCQAETGKALLKTPTTFTKLLRRAIFECFSLKNNTPRRRTFCEALSVITLPNNSTAEAISGMWQRISPTDTLVRFLL